MIYYNEIFTQSKISYQAKTTYIGGYMKIFNNIKDLSKELNIPEWKCERDSQKFIGHDYAIIEDTEIRVAVKNNEFNYIVLDLESNEDCRKYFMEYDVAVLSSFHFA